MTPTVFFRDMVLIRTVELKLLELFSQGHISGTVHTCIGQEACAVGVMHAADRGVDVVFSNHCAHGHILAYGIPIKLLVAEILGRVSGSCSGIGGSQHLHWRNFYTTGIQGGLVPVCVGAALAEKHKKSGAVILIFLGDGTMGQGIVYEGFNLAALWNLPVVFVLEDNKYAQSTPRQTAHTGDLYRRSESFGIPCVTVDGNDVERVYASAHDVIETTRASSRPHFLVLDTYRLGPHSKGDDTRPIEEVRSHWSNDPLLRSKKRLDLSAAQDIEDRVLAEVTEEFTAALSEPCLPVEEFLKKYGER